MGPIHGRIRIIQRPYCSFLEIRRFSSASFFIFLVRLFDLTKWWGIVFAYILFPVLLLCAGIFKPGSHFLNFIDFSSGLNLISGIASLQSKTAVSKLNVKCWSILMVRHFVCSYNVATCCECDSEGNRNRKLVQPIHSKVTSWTERSTEKIPSFSVHRILRNFCRLRKMLIETSR